MDEGLEGEPVGAFEFDGGGVWKEYKESGIGMRLERMMKGNVESGAVDAFDGSWGEGRSRIGRGNENIFIVRDQIED